MKMYLRVIKLLEKLTDVFFWADLAGAVFCLVCMIVTDHPIRSAGLMLICTGMTMALAQLNVALEKECAMTEKADQEKAIYKCVKKVQLEKLYEEDIA